MRDIELEGNYRRTDSNSTNETIETVKLKEEHKQCLYNTETSTKTKTCYQKIGNTHAFWFNKDGDPLILIGPHWPFFSCFISAVAFSCLVFFISLWNTLPLAITIPGLLIAITQLSSYSYTFLKNPGLPKLNHVTVNDGKIESQLYKFCNECHIFVRIDSNSQHCTECDVCIEGYDHHCPWTSKCVGKGNIYGFYVFVISTLCLFGFLFFGLAVAGAYTTK